MDFTVLNFFPCGFLETEMQISAGQRVKQYDESFWKSEVISQRSESQSGETVSIDATR